MARIGVSFIEVAKAASELIGKGKNPTVEQIRLLLGTGSSTTIANHLRQWKNNQESTSLIAAKETLPQELVSMLKGLWERVLHQAEEKIIVIENNFQQSISVLQQEVAKYKTNNQRWQKLHDQWIQEKAKLENEKLTLELELSIAQKENSSLNNKQEALLQQLQEKEMRVQELHTLHKQTQANLEHYRESMREQKLLDQQQYEQQKQLLQTDNTYLQEQLTIQRDKMSQLHQEMQTLLFANSTLEKSNEKIMQQLEDSKQALNHLEKTKNEYQNENKYWQKQQETCQKLLNDKVNSLIDLQSENKLLTQQLIISQKKLDQIEAQNKLLIHDKWLLAEEKAQLEGQLKQMQKMTTASL